VATPALSATASSGLLVTLASTTPAVCTVSGTTLTLVAAGTCTITANQSGNSGYAAAATISQTFTVAPAAVVTSAANGKLLYANNGVMSCGGCHGTPPSLQKVLNGANSPSTIANAINSNKGSMGVYAGKFTAQNLSDIAAYLAQPNL
jgi:mono/diheme cytochrome c family protein